MKYPPLQRTKLISDWLVLPAWRGGLCLTRYSSCPQYLQSERIHYAAGARFIQISCLFHCLSATPFTYEIKQAQCPYLSIAVNTC